MKILEVYSPARAWCIDRKGNIIPVKVHPFGAAGEDSVEDAAWLYLFTDYSNKQSLLEYICNELILEYAIDDYTDGYSIVEEELDSIESLKGHPGLNKLISTISNSVKDILEGGQDAMTETDIDKLGNDIKTYLNQNYTRVRYGSHYQNYTEREGSIYFRIASDDGYNWYDDIINFLDKAGSRFKLKDITIEKDIQATGVNRIYVDHLSLSDFLMRKPIVIESVKACGR